MSRPTALVMLLPVLLGPAPAVDGKKDAPATPSPSKRERLLEIYTQEAAGYTIYLDSSRKEKVELQREPVYVWTNPVRGGAQDGAVFVWKCRGRAEAVGTFFSYPSTGARSLNHELHSLSLSVLDVTRQGPHTWTPLAPGVALTPIPDAPEPARSAPQRLSQMRVLIRDFAACTQDPKGQRWELRILPQPLYRYQSTDPNVADGAVFSFVTSAGTDPEVLVLLEARRPAGAAAPTWQYGLARFTDLNLWVRHKGKVVFAALYVPWDSPIQDPKHRYRCFRDRSIPAIEDEDQ